MATDYTKQAQQLYQNTLGRQGDQEGIDYWASQLASGKSPEEVQNDFNLSAKTTESDFAKNFGNPQDLSNNANGVNYNPEARSLLSQDLFNGTARNIMMQPTILGAPNAQMDKGIINQDKMNQIGGGGQDTNVSSWRPETPEQAAYRESHTAPLGIGQYISMGMSPQEAYAKVMGSTIGYQDMKNRAINPHSNFTGNWREQIQNKLQGGNMNTYGQQNYGMNGSPYGVGQPQGQNGQVQAPRVQNWMPPMGQPQGQPSGASQSGVQNWMPMNNPQGQNQSFNGGWNQQQQPWQSGSFQNWMPQNNWQGGQGTSMPQVGGQYQPAGNTGIVPPNMGNQRVQNWMPPNQSTGQTQNNPYNQDVYGKQAGGLLSQWKAV